MQPNGSNGKSAHPADDVTEPKRRPSLLSRAKRHWTALTFLAVVAGGGASAAMLWSAKASGSDVRESEERTRVEIRALDTRVNAVEREQAAHDEAFWWIKQSLERIESRLGTQPVLP